MLEFIYRRHNYLMTRNVEEPWFDSLEKIERISTYDRDTTIQEDALSYLNGKTDHFYYPGKAYAVAALLSFWVSRIFKGDPKDYLRISDLLIYDCQYKAYDTTTATVYDTLLVGLSEYGVPVNENTKIAWKQFLEEFGITEDERKLCEFNG